MDDRKPRRPTSSDLPAHADEMIAALDAIDRDAEPDRYRTTAQGFVYAYAEQKAKESARWERDRIAAWIRDLLKV